MMFFPQTLFFLLLSDFRESRSYKGSLLLKKGQFRVIFPRKDRFKHGIKII